jgi:hypothetical protein
LWQSPETCTGVFVVAVPAAVNVVPQSAFVQDGCWQSSVTPGQSPSPTHWTHSPVALHTPGRFPM